MTQRKPWHRKNYLRDETAGPLSRGPDWCPDDDYALDIKEISPDDNRDIGSVIEVLGIDFGGDFVDVVDGEEGEYGEDDYPRQPVEKEYNRQEAYYDSGVVTGRPRPPIS